MFLKEQCLRVIEPVLTLAMNETQDELHAKGDGVHPGSATSSPVVSAIPLISAEKHDQVNDEVMDANFPAHGAGLSADASIGGEDSTSKSAEEDIHVIDVDTTRADMDGVPSPFERVEGMTHANPRIQKDLDLLQRVKEYDQRIA